jgi:hypothetical protein
VFACALRSAQCIAPPRIGAPYGNRTRVSAVKGLNKRL